MHPDSARFKRYEGLEGLEVMNAHWMTRAFPPHMHDVFAVSLNCGGGGGFHCAGERCLATPGTCSLIGPGEVHTGQAMSGDGWAYRNLYIDRPFMRTLVESVGATNTVDMNFKTPTTADPILASRLADVFGSLDDHAPLLERESLLLRVIERLVTAHSNFAPSRRFGGRELKGVAIVKQWLEAHPDADGSIGSLAQLAQLSPYYLIRSFRKAVGMPPHHYLMAIRINKAQKLLKAGVPITDAALSLGFFDQSHLSRSFKKILGVTPGEYLRR